jgi:predicted ATPase/predicted Ser/Thr protein kinase
MAEFIRGRYEPLEVVGAGGQSTVLRALDHRHRRVVGLKVRPRGSPEEEGSLLSEARILLGLEPHPRLCRVLEDFFAGDRYFLVMEWVEGRTLADLLAEAGGGGLPLPEVVHYLSQVAEALDHLHRHRPSVVHGDVKPANVIVTPDAQAVLVDFGISHRQSADDAALPRFALAGTAGYAAPEVAAGQAPSPAADVFSLGATAFALLTGGPPRPGARPAWTGIDGERARLVEYALRRGLAVDPARRPATASALIDALRGQLRTPNNLPAQATPFVGRTSEVADVEALLATSRMVTLTGAGGIGKRRLAVQVAADRLPEHPDGVFVVDLTGLSDPASPVVLACAALGLQQQSVNALVAHLERRNVLLVLEGCEAAPAPCAELVAALLAASPHVHFVVTSRQPLGIAGEAVYEAPPLSAPDLFRLPTLDRLGDFDAVRLFVERAAAVVPGFDVRASDAPGLAQVIRRLDAIPLALELAAPRVGDAALVWLVLDIAERFPLLDGSRRTATQQEATLDAVVDWACEPLAPAERRLFQRLSVFVGGFTTAAAAAVCEGFADELLCALATRGLVATDGTRWSIHDAVRRHGVRGLAGAGEEDATRRRHLEWALAVPEEGIGDRANVLAAKAWAASRRA